MSGNLEALLADQLAVMQERDVELLIWPNDRDHPTLMHVVVTGEERCRDVAMAMRVLMNLWEKRDANAADDPQPADS